jgi:hypothetical protein
MIARRVFLRTTDLPSRQRSLLRKPIDRTVAAINQDEAKASTLPSHLSPGFPNDPDLTTETMLKMVRRKTYTSSFMQVTVGEYGDSFAQSLLDAWWPLEHLIPADRTPKRLQRLQRIWAQTHLTPHETVQMGIESTIEALAQLTTYKVEGFDNPYELVLAIGRSGVVEKLAGLLPLHVLRPATRSGLTFPGPLLVRDGEDRVRLSNEFSKLLRTEKRQYLKDIEAEEKEPGSTKRHFGEVPTRGEGCPMSRGKSPPLGPLIEAVTGWIYRRNDRQSQVTGRLLVGSPGSRIDQIRDSLAQTISG